MKRQMKKLMTILMLLALAASMFGMAVTETSAPNDVVSEPVMAYPEELEDMDFLDPTVYGDEIEEEPVEEVKPTPVPEVPEEVTEDAGLNVPKTLELGVKETYTLKPGKKCTYKTSKKSVATVSKGGVITGKKKGTATISVLVNGRVKAKCKVTVKAAPTSIKLSKKTLGLNKGKKATLKATLSSDSASKITWTSSKKKVATVDENGEVTAVGVGTATITAKTYNKKKATCKVTVVKGTVPTKLTVDVTALTLGAGESRALKPKVNAGAGAIYTYTTNKKAIATVSAKGVVKGVKAGSAKITVKTHNGLKKVVAVTVKNAPASLTLNRDQLQLSAGETFALVAQMAGDAASKITYTTSNAAVATVNESGLVTAVANGQATITAKTFNGKTATCAVVVAPKPTPTPEPTVTPGPTVTPEPVVSPTVEPTITPTAGPGTDPTAEPGTEPTPEPSVEPSAEPSPEPSAEPSPEPVDPDFEMTDGVVTGYTGEGGDITVPSKDADGNAIVAIGEGAFKGNADIYSVVLPATVTEIRASAFEDCGNLEQVTLPNGVTTIGVAAFKNCNYLRNMTTFD